MGHFHILSPSGEGILREYKVRVVDWCMKSRAVHNFPRGRGIEFTASLHKTAADRIL